jgi:hypothetical protein
VTLVLYTPVFHIIPLRLPASQGNKYDIGGPHSMIRPDKKVVARPDGGLLLMYDIEAGLEMPLSSEL